MQQESGREKELICLEGMKDSFTEEVDNELRRDQCWRTGRAAAGRGTTGAETEAQAALPRSR